MRELRNDRNDRLRTVLFAWWEHSPDPTMLPALIEALEKESSEFVRPALTRAIAAHGSDARAREALVPLVARGDDYFRGAVIEALGDYRGSYALAEIAEVAKLDGPLQDDAITALGKIGDASTVALLGSLQKTAVRELQPTIVGGALPAEAGMRGRRRVPAKDADVCGDDRGIRAAAARRRPRARRRSPRTGGSRR